MLGWKLGNKMGFKMRFKNDSEGACLLYCCHNVCVELSLVDHIERMNTIIGQSSKKGGENPWFRLPSHRWCTNWSQFLGTWTMIPGDVTLLKKTKCYWPHLSVLHICSCLWLLHCRVRTRDLGGDIAGLRGLFVCESDKWKVNVFCLIPWLCSPGISPS